MRYTDMHIIARQEARRDAAQSITCKHCGKTGLKWRRTAEGWRLADPRNGVHVCDKAPSANDFEVLGV